MPKLPKVILWIETSVAYGRGLLSGITKYSNIHGFWSFYTEPGEEGRALPRLKDWQADGIIARIYNNKQAQKLAAAGLPAIVVPTREKIPGFPNILDDCSAEGKMAADYLLDRGFSRFAYCGFTNVHWSQGRQEGFRKRIKQAGFELHVHEQSRTKIRRSYKNQQTRIADWLKSLPKPIGLMTCDDERGRHVIEACRMAGLAVPEEIAVIGVDNDELVCTLAQPPLSSIAVNTERAGYEAAEMLDKMMAGKKIKKRNILVKPQYVMTRQSTDILAIEDREVARAVRFIRQHANQLIQVRDVVREAAVSRRELERRFRRDLGRSVLNEIKRVRTEQVARMLLDTNLTVTQIALSLGYSSLNLARYFRRQMGLTPLAYRKKFGHK